MSEDLPVWLRELVAEFLVEYPKWYEISVECSSRGHALCDVAVEDFLTFCSNRPLDAESCWMPMRENPDGAYGTAYHLVPHPLYPLGKGCCDHNVVVVRDWAIDFTPRQYEESLPFPFIWRVKWAGDSTSYRVPVTEATTVA